jgi:4'-phosphopantetheinyl transferase
MRGLTFVEAHPEVAAAGPDSGSIDLWRVPYTLAQGRTPLLTLLASYLRIPASAVILDRDDRGKPHLAHSMSGQGNMCRLDFNWSHSGDYALVAICRDGAVGVDIERHGKNLRTLDLARRFFAPSETEALASFPPEVRDRAFIGLWCAKEAVLKAAGEGLSFGLARLAFAHRGAEDWTLANVDPALGEVAAWQVVGFDAAPGYRGSLAWRGGPRKIRALSIATIGTI